MEHTNEIKGRGAYFEGWYLKHQWQEGELAVIPAIHQGKRGEQSSSIQVITKEQSKLFEFSGNAVELWSDLFQVRVGESWFSEDGVHLELSSPELTLSGELRYGPLTPLKTDIMGPFRFVPFMQCRHGVVSMWHRVDGLICINGKNFIINNGMGYIETDRGRSFPKAYLWTQCSWRERQHGSLMLSIAHIPMGLGSFTGCICEILFAGRSYRLATYQGARVERWSEQGAVVTQKNLRLEVELLSQNGRPLQAPTGGRMKRTIHESLCATVCYRFFEGDSQIFEHLDERASFEYSKGDLEKK